MTGNQAGPTRVVSIDALRGFDMFWIIGGDALFRAIFDWGRWPLSPELREQLVHVPWEGFRFYDLIFPLFLFLVGCVLPYSMEKYREQPAAAHWRIARRTALLILMGLIFNDMLQFDWSDLRWSGVLQRIGICYGVVALIYLHTRLSTQIALGALILAGYWALLALTPVPGSELGPYSIEGNLAGYLDRLLLPGRIMEQYYGWGDNEGILSTLPALVTTLLGVQAGRWLRTQYGGWRKVIGLVLAGLTFLAAGWLWAGAFPVIKNIWTSSFVLVAAGWSLLLLGGFYAVIDVLGFRKWAFFFVVIGMNPLTIYFMQRFVDFDEIAEFFVAGLARLSGNLETVVLLAGTLLVKWLLLWFLYRHRVFLRV